LIAGIGGIVSVLHLHIIEKKIADFVTNGPENVLPGLTRMRMYERPLIGVASANDVLWEELKHPDVVGPQHLSPIEWLPDAVSVISCFLPFTDRIRSANRKPDWPAIEWLYGRYEGEMFGDVLRRFIVAMVEKECGRALAPTVDQRFVMANFRSNWSERHVAFIAGLGTFSLNRSLITNRGSAGRFASVITDVVVEPTTRPYSKPDEYCTKCGACIRRCPPAAITEDGKDNVLCFGFLQQTLARHKPRYGCGKCQTGVPCEAQRPSADVSKRKLTNNSRAAEE
jgi:epoxyqueuosine reductase QueG